MNAKEKVMIYELLSDLKDYVETTHSRVFCILPVTTDIPKESIYRWIDNKQREIEKVK